MTKRELEIRLKIAEKAINCALVALGNENVKKLEEKEAHKNYPFNLVNGYARACGQAQAYLENYEIKSKDIEEYGLDLVERILNFEKKERNI